MSRKAKLLSLIVVLAANLLISVASPTVANAAVLGDSLEWGLPLVSGVGPTYSTPTAVHPDTYIASLSVGSAVLALHNDATGTAWGNNDSGQLGDGTTGTPDPANEVRMQLPAVVQLSAGGNSFGAALDGNGVVYTFGRNYENELGRTGGAAPNPVPNLPIVQQISAGLQHMLALAQDGSVWAWGDNAHGQLGDPNSTSGSQAFPTRVLNLPQIVKIFTKFDTNFAMDQTGKIWAWGENSQGQFGAPSSDGVHHGYNAVPQVVTGIPLMKQIAPARISVTALSTTGQVWTWGNNTDGELGDGSALTSWHSPVAVPGLTNVKSIGSGQDDSYAVLNDGSLKGWGWNFAGELGIGNSIEQNTPITIPGVSNAAGVDANGTHAVTWKEIQQSPASVTSLTVSVGPTTPMYNMDVNVGLAGVTCPARIITTIGDANTTSSTLCASGQTAPASVKWSFNVRSLHPQMQYQISTTVDDANGATAAMSAKFITPYPPQWIAVGDSFSSGHHQDSDEPCTYSSFAQAVIISSANGGRIDGTCMSETGATSLKANDQSFSWPSRAVIQINSHYGMPTEWKMQLLFLAASGASTQDFTKPITYGCAGCHQGITAESAAQAYAGSWNIFSASGGADDVNFSQTLRDFYKQGVDVKPWTVQTRPNCPDTDALNTNVQSLINGGNIGGKPANPFALRDFFRSIKSADPNARLFAITYPHVLNPNDVCAPNDPNLLPHIGTDAVVDNLDDGYIVPLYKEGVNIIDLRKQIFNNVPRDYLQLQRYFGYPHPNDAAQSAIATSVSNLIN